MLKAEFSLRSQERISTSAENKPPGSFVISVFGPLNLLLTFRPGNLTLSSLSKSGIFQVNWLGVEGRHGRVGGGLKEGKGYFIHKWSLAPLWFSDVFDFSSDRFSVLFPSVISLFPSCKHVRWLCLSLRHESGWRQTNSPAGAGRGRAARAGAGEQGSSEPFPGAHSPLRPPPSPVPPTHRNLLADKASPTGLLLLWRTKNVWLDNHLFSDYRINCNLQQR